MKWFASDRRNPLTALDAERRAMTAFDETQRRRLLDRRQRLPDTPEGRQQATEIDDALARLDAGHYGRCQVCEGPIGRSRLVALPEARRCLGCDSQRSDPSAAAGRYSLA